MKTLDNVNKKVEILIQLRGNTEIKNNRNEQCHWWTERGWDKLSQFDNAIETSQTEKHRGKKTLNIQEIWDNYIRCNISVVGIPEEKKREINKRNIWSNNNRKIPPN